MASASKIQTDLLGAKGYTCRDNFHWSEVQQGQRVVIRSVYLDSDGAPKYTLLINNTLHDKYASAFIIAKNDERRVRTNSDGTILAAGNAGDWQADSGVNRSYRLPNHFSDEELVGKNIDSIMGEATWLEQR